MPRSPLAYRLDIVELRGQRERAAGPGSWRLPRQPARPLGRRTRVHPHREAVASLTRLEPSLSERISHSRRIIGFRNQLAHDYAAVNDTVVWAIALGEVPVLREECQAILAERDAGGKQTD
jgi:hypothetical protein